MLTEVMKLFAMLKIASSLSYMTVNKLKAGIREIDNKLFYLIYNLLKIVSPLYTCRKITISTVQNIENRKIFGKILKVKYIFLRFNIVYY